VISHALSLVALAWTRRFMNPREEGSTGPAHS
jgi:hypothetical protein